MILSNFYHFLPFLLHHHQIPSIIQIHPIHPAMLSIPFRTPKILTMKVAAALSIGATLAWATLHKVVNIL